MIVLNVVSLREGLRRENEIAERDKENDCRSGEAPSVSTSTGVAQEASSGGLVCQTSGALNCNIPEIYCVFALVSENKSL